MEEAPERSHAAKNFEASSLRNIRNRPQDSPTSPRAPLISMIGFDDHMSFAVGGVHAKSPSQTFNAPPSLHAYGGIDSPGLNSFQNVVHFQGQNDLSTNKSSNDPLQTVQPITQKRAQKSLTMSAKIWKPSEARIRQLYVCDKKQLHEVREIINNEFGFIATERQYKAKIKQMKLERNVKAKERKTIIHHLQRRNAVGKKSSRVQVRGHIITQEKLCRWMEGMKESDMTHLRSLAISPSPLPSDISIRTNSILGVAKATSCDYFVDQQPGLRSMNQNDLTRNAMQRLFAHTHKHIIDSQEARAVFENLKLILDCKRSATDHPDGNKWHSVLEEDVTGLQNLMKGARKIAVHREESDLHKAMYDFPNAPLKTRSFRGSLRNTATWIIPHGRVEASFWTSSNETHLGIADGNDSISTAARVVIIPSRTILPSVRLQFDFAHYLDPSARITYQATIPNDSEVFLLVRRGQIKPLIEALDKGTAHLTDRDEEGRSLLNYAYEYGRINMCRLLLERQADPNAFERTRYGVIGPICQTKHSNDSEDTYKWLDQRGHCTKLLLEAGADFSLEGDFGGGIRQSCFVDAIETWSIARFKPVMDCGGTFISPKDTLQDGRGNECSPLFLLAEFCGYRYFETIHILEKAILLLERAADVSWRNSSGDNILHASLKSKRYHEAQHQSDYHFCMSLTEPKQFLILCITAGADVYATNNGGETPSLVAQRYRHEREWAEALSQCGYDPTEVFAQSDASILDGTRITQTSKLSFEEYCQRREEYLRFKKMFFEESCRSCGDAFRPERVSIDESCTMCGEEFRVKGSPVEERYQPFQDQYLHEQAFLKQICEEADSSDEDEESNLNGSSDERAEGDEQLELDYGAIELNGEHVFGKDRNGADFDEREWPQNGVSIGREEGGIDLEHDFTEDFQALEDRNGEWNWLEMALRRELA